MRRPPFWRRWVGLAEAGVPDPQRDARRLLTGRLEGGKAPTRRPQLAFRRGHRPARGAGAGLADHRARAPSGSTISRSPTPCSTRGPDTETLVEIALGPRFDRVLDLGTGSGCILLSLLAERPGASGLGTDISAAALATARRNAARLGVEGAAFLQSDWFADVTGRFDLIVSNPPYIAAPDYAGLAPEVRHDPRRSR
jgi:release factor glutamine methyltransferase